MDENIKVGDYIRIKSLDWYNYNADEYGNIRNDSYDIIFDINKKLYCNYICKVLDVKENILTVLPNKDNYDKVQPIIYLNTLVVDKIQTDEYNKLIYEELYNANILHMGIYNLLKKLTYNEKP